MTQEIKDSCLLEGFFCDYKDITDPTKMNVYLITAPEKYRYEPLTQETTQQVIQPIIDEIFKYRENAYLNNKDKNTFLAQFFEVQEKLYPNGDIPASGIVFNYNDERFLLLSLTRDQSLLVDVCYQDRILKKFSHEWIDMDHQQEEVGRFLSLYEQQRKTGWRTMRNEENDEYIVRDLAFLSPKEKDDFIVFLDAYKIPYSYSQINHRDHSVTDAVVVPFVYRNVLEQAQLMEKGRQEGWGDLKNWRATKIGREKMIVTPIEHLTDEQTYSLKKVLKNLNLPFMEQMITSKQGQIPVIAIPAQYTQRFSQNVNQSAMEIEGFVKKGLFARFSRGRND